MDLVNKLLEDEKRIGKNFHINATTADAHFAHLMTMTQASPGHLIAAPVAIQDDMRNVIDLLDIKVLDLEEL